MRKAEFRQKLDACSLQITKENYAEAAAIADELDLEMVTDVRRLKNIAKAYEKCRRYIDAEDILLLARDYAPKSRAIQYRLGVNAVKAGELENAHKYLEEFAQEASDDVQYYALKYRLAVAENASAEELIEILEASTKIEPDDRLMYVLAEMYVKTGRNDDAISLCNEIELWFSNGKYQEQARALREKLGGEGLDFDAIMKYAEPEEDEAEKEDSPAAQAAEEANADMADEDEDPEVDDAAEDLSRYSEGYMQEELVDGMQIDLGLDDEEEDMPQRMVSPEADAAGEGAPSEDYEADAAEEYQTKTDAYGDDEDDEIPDSLFEVAFDIEDPESGETAEEAEPESEEETPVYTNTIYSVPRSFGGYGIMPDDEAVPAPAEEKLDNEFESDTEAGRALRERTEKAMDPDEWNHFTVDDEDDDEKEIPEEAIPDETVPVTEAFSDTEEDFVENPAAEAEIEEPAAEETETEEPAAEETETEETRAEETETEEPAAEEAETEESAAEEAEPEAPAAEEPEPEEPAAEEAETEETAAEEAEPEEPAAEETETEEPAAEEAEAEEPAAEEAEEPENEMPVIEMPSDEEVFTEETADAVPEADEDAAEEEADTAENLTEDLPEVSFDIEDTAEKEENRENVQDALDRIFTEEVVKETGSEVDAELQKRKSEKALFANIPSAPDVSEGLWHFIVYSEERKLALECAREEIRELSQHNESCPEKMLKINAAKIADASIVNSLDRFLGNIVIVEECNWLSAAQLKDFTKILDRDDRSLLVIFTDTKAHVIDMLRREPQLAECFTGVFEGKRYTPDELLKEAKEYLFMEAAKLSKGAETVVYEEGRRLLAAQNGFYRSDIIEFVSKALAVADKGGFFGLTGGKCDKEGYLIVTEKHFKKAAKE